MFNRYTDVESTIACIQLREDPRLRSIASCLALRLSGVDLSDSMHRVVEDLAVLGERYGATPDDIQQVLLACEPALGIEY